MDKIAVISRRSVKKIWKSRRDSFECSLVRIMYVAILFQARRRSIFGSKYNFVELFEMISVEHLAAGISN